VWIEVESRKLNKNGMVVDFEKLKKMLEEYDHRNLNVVMEGKNTTAENIAKRFVEEIRDLPEMIEVDLKRVRVEVWETENNCAVVEWREGDD